MTSYRRSNDARLIVLLTVACTILAIVQLVERFWPLILLAAAGVIVWRGRRAGVLRARADRNDLQRQVAKLERDAARHDELVGELEDAAGRPVEAVIASYRHVQRQYQAVPQKTENGV